MMDLNKRTALILKYMINSKGPLNGAELASILGTTGKTVGAEIKTISRILNNFGADIISQKGVGYSLDVHNKAEFDIFVQCFNEKILNNMEWSYYSIERIKYIIYHLCFEEGFLKAQILADKMYVSMSTLAGDLKRVRKILNEYHIVLIHKPSYGLKMNGAERHLRHLMTRYMYADEEEIYMNEPGAVCFMDSMKIQKQLLKIFEKNQFHVSYKSFEEIAKYCIISCYRISRGYGIKEGDIYKKLPDKCQEYRIAGEIAACMDEKWSDYEIASLAALLISRRIFNTAREFMRCGSAYEINLADDMIYFLISHFMIHVSGKSELKLQLAMFFRSLVMRTASGFELHNWNKNLIKKDMTAYEFAVAAAMYLRREKQIMVMEEDITVLACLIGNYLDRTYPEEQKVNILYVFWNGRNMAQYYAAKIRKYYAEFIRQESYREFQELSEQDYDTNDVIITDMPKQKYIQGKTEVFQITDNFSKAEMGSLEHYLMSKEKNIKKLLKMFSENLFWQQINEDNRFDILDFMSDGFIKNNIADHHFKERIFEREGLSTSEMENGIAFITDNDCHKEVRCAVGLLKKPVLWKNEYVQIVFMLYGSWSETNILDIIQKIQADVKVIHRLMQIKNFEQFISFLKDLL